MSVTDTAGAAPLTNGLLAAGQCDRSRLWGAGKVVDRFLGLEALVAASVLALIFLAIPRSMADPDIWWHMRNAQDMLAQHTFIRHDQFSFTAQGSQWIDHEWLSELPFYLGWRAGGATGVYLVTVSAIEAIFAGVLWLCWRASASWCTASLTTIAAALLATISFGPRTLLFGWICLVVELVVLETFRQRPAAVFALPVLFGIWVNLHGSWAIGLAVLALHSVLGHMRMQGDWIQPEIFSARQSRRLLLAWLMILPALFCNPWGWRLVAYPFNFAFRQTLNVANVQEWHSLDLQSLRGRVVIAAVLLIVGRQFWHPRKWSLTELGLLFLGLFSAFHHSRFLFLLALLGAPVAARSFARRVPSPRVHTRPAMNAALLAIVLALLVGSFRKASAGEDKGMEQFPVEALPFLAHLDPHRRLFNEFLWGGYLEWSHPEIPVFIDSRVDIFEYNGTFKDYLDVIYITNTLALLDRYRIEYVFFEKDTPLVYLLRHTGGWKLDYEDRKNVLLERTPTVPRQTTVNEITGSADKREEGSSSLIARVER